MFVHIELVCSNNTDLSWREKIIFIGRRAFYPKSVTQPIGTEIPGRTIVSDRSLKYITAIEWCFLFFLCSFFRNKNSSRECFTGRRS